MTSNVMIYKRGEEIWYLGEISKIRLGNTPGRLRIQTKIWSIQSTEWAMTPSARTITDGLGQAPWQLQDDWPK